MTWTKEDDLAARRDWYKRNKEHEKSRIHERRRQLNEWVKSCKVARGCSRCPEKHFACLDWHHLNSDDKEIGIQRAVRNGYGRERLQQEMDKCIVLCSNCHRKEHNPE